MRPLIGESSIFTTASLDTINLPHLRTRMSFAAASSTPGQGPRQRRGIAFKKPPTTLRGVFAGCGTILNHPSMAPHVLSLTGKGSNPRDVTVLYLGTPSYDVPSKRVAQTSHYVELGCTVTSLDVVLEAPTVDHMRSMVDGADIILVSGGNTSFAMRRWKHLGLDVIIEEACLGERKVVMAGGSAGAICWWSGGHSDSLDPDSFKEEKLHPHSGGDRSSGGGDIEDEGASTTTAAPPEEGGKEEEANEQHEEAHEWDYIRVNGLGFVPGLCCPHHDRVQSNGILRASDFDAMLHRHPTEVGICIDHNAAFLIDRDSYRVITPIPRENEAPFPGSVADDGSFSYERLGSPGVWIKEMVDCGTRVKCWQCPSHGKINDLLKVPETINVSIRHMNRAALLNPDDGPMRRSFPGYKSKSFYGGEVHPEYMEAMAQVSEEEKEEEKEER